MYILCKGHNNISYLLIFLFRIYVIIFQFNTKNKNRFLALPPTTSYFITWLNLEWKKVCIPPPEAHSPIWLNQFNPLIRNISKWADMLLYLSILDAWFGYTSKKYLFGSLSWWHALILFIMNNLYISINNNYSEIKKRKKKERR